MRTLDLQNDTKWLGAQELEYTTNGGVVPLRYDAATLAQLDKLANMGSIARYPTGIEAQVKGNIRELQITVKTLDSDGYGLIAELYANESRVLPFHQLSPEKGATTTLNYHYSYDALATAAPVFRFIFPTHTALEILSIEVDDAATIERDFDVFTYRQRSGALDKSILFYGDSITHGANVTSPCNAWPDLVSRQLGLECYNVSIGGHGLFERPIAENIARRSGLDAISIHCGTNWSFETHGDEEVMKVRVKKFIQIIRAKQPDIPMIVCTPIYKGKRNDRDVPTLLKRQTAVIGSVVNDLVAGGDDHLILVDGLTIVRDTWELASDRVHLDDYGSMTYAQRMNPIILSVLTN